MIRRDLFTAKAWPSDRAIGDAVRDHAGLTHRAYCSLINFVNATVAPLIISPIIRQKKHKTINAPGLPMAANMAESGLLKISATVGLQKVANAASRGCLSRWHTSV